MLDTWMLLQKGKASTSISISFLATNISKYSVMGNYLMVETLKDANSHSSHHHLAGDQINTIVVRFSLSCCYCLLMACSPSVRKYLSERWMYLDVCLFQMHAFSSSSKTMISGWREYYRCTIWRRHPFETMFSLKIFAFSVTLCLSKQIFASSVILRLSKHV